jgi:hypothetical protein
MAYSNSELHLHERYESMASGSTPWTSDQSAAWPLLHRMTQHINTNIHASSGIRTYDPSNQAATTHTKDHEATWTGFPHVISVFLPKTFEAFRPFEVSIGCHTTVFFINYVPSIDKPPCDCVNVRDGTC